MAYRVDSRRSTEQPGRRASARRPLEPVVDRPRRIDACIDYFGTGDARSLSDSSDSCGESILDEGEAQKRFVHGATRGDTLLVPPPQPSWLTLAERRDSGA